MNIPNSRFVILQFNSLRRFAARILPFAAMGPVLCAPLLFAQTVGTGSIAGKVSDPARKPLADAKVEITNKAKGARIYVTTSAEGVYSSGPIQPGDYVLLVEIRGFNPALFPVAVHVGNVTRVDVVMKVGPEVGQVQVPGGTAVNIEQAVVQSVVNADQMDKLPVNGRNFLDLAQLEPGVQMQDGGIFSGKDGLSSISFLDQYGRSERIAVDGVDISDETVGGTTQNIPASAIREFQLAQSSLDLSTGLTSSGAVNVITRSGSDQIHGGVFGVYRGDQGAASLPGSSLPGSTKSSSQRELFGGDAGGAIIKNRVFWFADAERAKQDLTAGKPFASPFDGLEATLAEPYREFNTDERVDWNMRGSTRAFYRINFFQNSDLRPFGSASSTQQFRNTNNTLTNALGVDFNTGAYAHSLRFEYLKLRNETRDATSGLSGVENPIPGLGINIGASTAGNCVLSNGGSYCGGPSWLGPQQTIQSDKEARYDGSRVMGKHVIRYGITFNRIDGARLEAYSAFPQVGTTSLVGSTSSDPTSYPADWVSLGNGVGFSTAKSSFGFAGGGMGPDNRVEMYVGDAWKSRPKLTLTYGLHYVRDSGRSDSGLGALPDLNQWGAGLGEKVRNPNVNFAPQFGFVWDAGGNGKTVVRGGGGLFYENSLWNNTLLDGPSRLSKGIFSDAPEVCQGSVANGFNWPTNPGVGTIAGAATVVTNPTTGASQVLANFCGGPISTVAPKILALSNAFQAAAATVTGMQPNSNFVGTTLSALNPNYDLLYPGYRTPRSWQINLGGQKEIRPGTVLSVDYVRNIGEHFLIGQDINHSGAARSFNQANAVAARDAAQVANGCPVGVNQATCMINSTFLTGVPLGVTGAQAAYSKAGLDSNLQAAGGAPCSYCAFPGTNAITGNNGALGGVDMLFPEGHSVYSGAQIKLVTRIDKPVQGVKTANLQVAYSLSRFVSPAQDQDFTNLAIDNDNPLRFTGPNGLDRKHQVSLSGTFDLPLNAKFSMIGHFYSPLPESLLLPELTNGGEIFASDWLGAGLGADTAAEPLPGTQIGQFEHSINIGNLQSVINKYNHSFAGSLTPAGDCIVGNNVQCPGQIAGPAVMTTADMAALGWTMPTVGSVAPHAVASPWLKSLDLRASWPIKVKERVTIEPSASVFNVFNFANAFLPGNMPSASLLPGQNGLLAPNVVGGVAPGSSLAPFRTSFQSGTYALGAPRRFEFGLRISF